MTDSNVPQSNWPDIAADEDMTTGYMLATETVPTNALPLQTEARVSLVVRPITLRHANAFVKLYHRHHKPARGCVFCISVLEDDTVLRGVAIVGRPVARMLQDGRTCEVLRVCTDGTYNACSKLYATVAKTARGMGYDRIVTYTLPSEGGASLKAAGWTCEEFLAGGGSWSRADRPRVDQHPTEKKLRWAA